MVFVQDGLIIDSPFHFQNILTCSLHTKFNEHAALSLEGVVLYDQDSLSNVRQDLKGQFVAVSYRQDDNENLLFVGTPLDVNLQYTNDLYVCTVKCVSFTYFLDIDKQKRSFQNTSDTYVDVLNFVYAKAKNAGGFYSDQVYKQIGAPIFQYNETDWEFTLRMASNLFLPVIPNYKSKASEIFVGLPKRKLVRLDSPEDLHQFKCGKSDRNELYFTLCTLCHYDLGDRIEYQGYSLVVVEKRTIYRNCFLENEYILGTADGYALKRYENKIAGLTLRGTVLARTNELLKLHLDIDPAQDVGAAYWFQYVPEQGNVMYCMPQLGTKAYIKFNSNADSSAVAIHCDRENGYTCAELSDFNKRYFTTEFEKRMAMHPSKLFFVADAYRIECNDSTGISASTCRKIKIKAKNSIKVSSKKEVLVQTPEHILVTQTGSGSVIDMAGTEINLDADEVNCNTTGASAEPSYPPTDVEPSFSISSNAASAAAGTVPSFSSGKR